MLIDNAAIQPKVSVLNQIVHSNDPTLVIPTSIRNLFPETIFKQTEEVTVRSQS
jgi:hypothetical protein